MKESGSGGWWHRRVGRFGAEPAPLGPGQRQKPRDRQLGPASLLAAVAGLLVFVGLSIWVIAQPVLSWGEALRGFAIVRTSTVLDTVMLQLSQLTAAVGNGVAVVAAVLLLLIAQRWRDALFSVVAVGGVAVFLAIAKAAFDSDRPLPDPLGPAAGSSFPSGHAAGWAALVMAIVLVIRQRNRRLLVVAGGSLIVMTIGASRVYLGAHYPRDVVASIALAVAWVASVDVMRQLLSRRVARTQQPPSGVLRP